MKSKPISEATQNAVLETAWRLIAEKGRVDVSQAEIAAAAGVTRQTVFYAFGSRNGLLTAMVRHKDATSPALARLVAEGTKPEFSVEQLFRFVAAWLDYLPDVFPVGALLDAAAMIDPEAKAAIEDRMVNTLLAGFKRRLGEMEAAGLLRQGLAADEAAETLWQAVHFSAWRLLVVERGWTPEAFRNNRMDLIKTMILR